MCRSEAGPISKRRLLAAGALLAGLAALAPARAQVNPFRTVRPSRPMPAEDVRMLADSIDQLNRMPDLRAGQTDSWSNPDTGGSGVNTVERIFRSHGMPCHRLQHFVVSGGRPEGRTYALTWCRTPQGEWKSRG